MNSCAICFSDNITGYSDTEDGPVIEWRCDQCDLEKKCETLTLAVKELLKSNDFYGDKSMWWRTEDFPGTYNIVDDDDNGEDCHKDCDKYRRYGRHHDYRCREVGGKLARETANNKHVLEAVKILEKK